MAKYPGCHVVHHENSKGFSSKANLSNPKPPMYKLWQGASLVHPSLFIPPSPATYPTTYLKMIIYPQDCPIMLSVFEVSISHISLSLSLSSLPPFLTHAHTYIHPLTCVCYRSICLWRLHLLFLPSLKHSHTSWKSISLHQLNLTPSRLTSSKS